MQVGPLVGHETVEPASTPIKSAVGTVAFDFGLLDGATRPVLCMTSRADTVTSALFPDATFVHGATAADAYVTKRLSQGGLRRASKPVLRLRPTLLRAPHRGLTDGTTWSATLSMRSQSGDESWPERIRLGGAARWLTPELAARARSVARRVVTARIGGTWWGRSVSLSAAGRAVVFAGVDPAATRRVLDGAMAAAGADRTIFVAGTGPAAGGRYAELGLSAVLAGVVDPWPLIEQAAWVHAAPDSDAAAIAELLGKDAKWDGARPGRVDPLEFAAATLILGARYVDPFTGRSIPCEDFLDLAEDWRRHASLKAAVVCCVGVSFWKRERIAAILGDAARPVFRNTAEGAVAAARRRGAMAVWPSRQPAGLEALACEASVPMFRIEDGFIRSVGLGAEFRPPLSVVCDRRGIYYDSTAPSDLEDILAHTRFDPALLARAAALRVRMVRDGVTKYNLAGDAALTVDRDRLVVLVPGQVADDRSVLLGGGGARPGLDLLARVREQAPDATIVYKPHPDVEAGFRAGAIPDADALRYADHVVRAGSMASLLDQVDAVHTLTSLTGFEALMRGKPVTTYGQPFYAGWGLTTDHNPVARRTRCLDLDALVAATLILYPLYIDPVTGLPCGPEIVLDRIADPALHRMTPLMRVRRWQGLLAARLRRRPKTQPHTTQAGTAA